MKRIICLVVLSLFALPLLARAEYVSGYFRKDGTYVNGYYRSSPDSFKWNNYGPKDNSSGGYSGRDNDNDGTPNYLDKDDDNDGTNDDNDKNQYGK